MMIRVKDLWLIRQNFTRVFTNERPPIAQAALLSKVGEAWQDALMNYQVSRQRIAEEHGLNQKDPAPSNDEEREAFATDRKRREDLANNELAELGEVEINVEHDAVPIRDLKGLNISIVDLAVMQFHGVIANGR